MTEHVHTGIGLTSLLLIGIGVGMHDLGAALAVIGCVLLAGLVYARTHG